MTNQLVIPFEEINQRRRNPYQQYGRFLTDRCYEAFDGPEPHWERHYPSPGEYERSVEPMRSRFTAMIGYNRQLCHTAV